jgi:hypothetical protein
MVAGRRPASPDGCAHWLSLWLPKPERRVNRTAGSVWHAKLGTTELRTLAAYVEALGGRLEIIADFGDQRLAFIEPGTEAA